MSTETREQFRERIGKVAHDAGVAHRIAHVDKGTYLTSYMTWEREPEYVRSTTLAISEAVYAAALRDVRDNVNPDDFTASLNDFAASLGIDLGCGDT